MSGGSVFAPANPPHGYCSGFPDGHLKGTGNCRTKRAVQCAMWICHALLDVGAFDRIGGLAASDDRTLGGQRMTARTGVEGGRHVTPARRSDADAGSLGNAVGPSAMTMLT
jgi:hypothetical protein